MASYSVGGSSSSSRSEQQIIPGMKDVYNQLYQANQNNYANILNAYNQGQATVDDQLGGILGDYNNLINQVYTNLGVGQGGWGVAAPAAQEIERLYQQSQGQNRQRLIDAGLGNTTVAPNVLNQSVRLAAQSYGNLGAQLADKAVGYQTQIAQAAQEARLRALGLKTGLSQQLSGNLAGYRFANTAGDLTGNVSSNQSSNTHSSGETGGGGYGGNGRGGRGVMGDVGDLAGLLGGIGGGGFGNVTPLGYAGGYGYGGTTAYEQRDFGGQPAFGEQVLDFGGDYGGSDYADEGPY